MQQIVEWLPIALSLAATGCAAGLLAGLLGIGGGIVIVPVLYFFLQWLGSGPATAMSVATGTSLLTIVPTSLSSIRSHQKRGNVIVPILIWWAPWIVVGVVIGVSMATRAGGHFTSAVFGVMAIVIAANMVFRARVEPRRDTLPHKAWQALIAGVIGAISAVMGIGGGTLGVTALSAYNIRTHQAIGTAASFGFVIAVPGAALMLFWGATPLDAPPGTIGLVNLFGFALIVPLTVMTAPLGVRLGAQLNSSFLRKVFAVFLALSGLRMLFEAVV